MRMGEEVVEVVAEVASDDEGEGEVDRTPSPSFGAELPSSDPTMRLLEWKSRAWRVLLVECRRGRREAGREELRAGGCCCRSPCRLAARCEAERWTARFCDDDEEEVEMRVVGGSGSLKRML